MIVTNPTPAMGGSAPAARGASELKFHDALKPLIEIPNAWKWVIGLAALAIAGAAAWLLWKYWRKKSSQLAMPPPVPPHVRARRTLERAAGLIGEPEPFTVLVSGAIRLYLEERFSFHAPDRTTEEFLYELRGTTLLTEDQKKSLSQFLASCDLIKFAKYDPTETELRGLLASAHRLINETEPREVPESIQSATRPAPGSAARPAALEQAPAVAESPAQSAAQEEPEATQIR